MKLKTFVFLTLIALGASLTIAVHAQTFSVIHTFNGPEGTTPESGITIRGGNLFGTASAGGNNDFGTAYEVMHFGSNWSTIPIYLFGGRLDGAIPMARVIFGPDGHPYGTTFSGGATGSGVVFDLIPPLTICKSANCFWKETPLYQFQSGNDGSAPATGDLAWDAADNIYGTTLLGGINDQGVVYQLMPSGNNWTENVLYRFSGDPDGVEPWSGIVFDAKGNIFGTTLLGGSYHAGTVFELSYVVGVGWTERIIYDFQDGSDGGFPYSGLIVDNSGNLYGATSSEGNGGGGTVFQLTPAAGTYVFNLLYSFSARGQSCGPVGTLTMDGSGVLYGTTQCAGAYGLGNIFKLTRTQNGWLYASLHDFTGGADGADPVGNVTIDTDGTLYGTAAGGGSYQGTCAAYGCGTVWMIKP